MSNTRPPDTATDFVLRELARRQPARLLARDARARGWAAAHATAHSCEVVNETGTLRIDVALVGDALDGLDKPAALLLLGELIRHAPVVLVAAQEESPLAFADFLSLGMQRLQPPDANGHAVYGFDLCHYKTVPDWLNAKYWAHPERWRP